MPQAPILAPWKVWSYEGRSDLERIKLAEFSKLPQVIRTVQHQLCLYPGLAKAELLELARAKVMIPTGVTRHLIPGRALGLNLDLGGTPGSPVYVRNLRLCDQHDAVGAPAVPEPGDTVTYLQDQDIACYTHELENVQPPDDVRKLMERKYAVVGR